MERRCYSIFLENGLEIQFPQGPLIEVHPFSIAEQRLAAQRYNIEVLNMDVISKARGEPTAEERKAKRVEEAMARNRYLGLDPSEAEAGIEPEVIRKWFIDVPPSPHSDSLATASGNKTGVRGKYLFKRRRLDPNLSAASVATASGNKEDEVGGRRERDSR